MTAVLKAIADFQSADKPLNLSICSWWWSTLTSLCCQPWLTILLKKCDSAAEHSARDSKWRPVNRQYRTVLIRVTIEFCWTDHSVSCACVTVPCTSYNHMKSVILASKIIYHQRQRSTESYSRKAMFSRGYSQTGSYGSLCTCSIRGELGSRLLMRSGRGGVVQR